MGKIIPQRIRLAGGRVMPVTKPEILAPAGDWECVRAAVENGADAVYFGLDRFNARMRANNFTLADLPELMAFLHERGLRGYLTFNTLVFTDELPEAENFLRAVIRAGVDAAIVQDIGICRLIRALSPDFPIHASTQMSVSSEAGVAFARELGASVVVLAREFSLKELTAIHEQTAAEVEPMPLEIFVHGALCVAYSGQCLTSESLGGRSANRGECAQACRLPYELVSDGQTVPLGNRRYLLSPQDLAGLSLLPEIIRAGVATLKIEGRLKAPEYVAAVTQVYRRALDDAWASLAEEAPAFSVAQEQRYQLEMTFSRGLDTGWLEGIDNQRLVHARFGKKRGVRLGRVVRVQPQGVWLDTEACVAVGDGVVFDAGRPDEPEEGARVFQLRHERGQTYLGFQRGNLDTRRVEPGQLVWKTSDPALNKALRQSWEGGKPRHRRAVKMVLVAAVGQPLSLVAEDGQGHRAEVASPQPLEQAQKQPTDAARIRQQLARLGDTPFELAELTTELDGRAMVPASVLNQVRREAVEQLIAARRQGPQWTLAQASGHAGRLVAEGLAGNVSRVPEDAAKSPYLIPLARDFAQLQVLVAGGSPELYLELEDPRKYPEAVALVRGAGRGQELWLAPPRVYKSGEQWIIKQLEKAGADGLLARNHEHLRAWEGRRVRADFSLNIANPLAARWLRERWQVERMTVSYDLDAEQGESLLRGCPPGWFELTLHQHMPMFHMEHCVFCAFMSDGKDYRDCGRPCEKHQVSLRDRVGAEHPLKADAGCRNTVFNSRAQTGAEYAHRFAEAGVAAFRIEFLNETPEEIETTMRGYQQLLQGEAPAEELWRKLKLINQLGVTRGTLKG